MSRAMLWMNSGHRWWWNILTSATIGWIPGDTPTRTRRRTHRRFRFALKARNVTTSQKTRHSKSTIIVCYSKSLVILLLFLDMQYCFAPGFEGTGMTWPSLEVTRPGPGPAVQQRLDLFDVQTGHIFTFLSPSRVHDFERCFSVKLPTVCPCEFLPFVGAFGSLDV